MTSPSAPVSQLTLAVGLMLLAFLCFAFMDTGAKLLVSGAIPALQVAFLRYLVHFCCALIIYLPRHGAAIVYSARPRVQALRAVFLLSATALNFTALAYLPLTTTIAIFFTAPLMVCLLSRPVLGETVGIKRLSAVFIGFIGVLIIVQPWSARFDWPMLLSLGAMLCASGYFVMSRLVANVDSNAVTQVYTAGIATIALAPVALLQWQTPETAVQWSLLLMIGALGFFGHSVLTRAHRHTQASILAPTVYSQLIYIAILSWLVFGEPPDFTTALGSLIIVGSGLYIWARERIAAKTGVNHSQQAAPDKFR